MELSKRLFAVADMVTSGNRVADVGCDHGFIPIWLVESGRIRQAVAMDINEGPLERAREHIAEHNLEEYIEVRLSDGVEKLCEDEADTVIIAGMGGPLMSKILSAGAEVLKGVQELILQPQSDVGAFRHFLEKSGYQITKENMILEDGKFYPMMRVIHGPMHYEKEIEYQYGSFLLKEKNEVLKEYLDKEFQTVSSILKELQQGNAKTDAAEIRIQELAIKISGILEAQDEMQ